MVRQTDGGLSSGHLLAAVSAGLVCGVIVIMIEISLASLIFSGNLSVHLSRGIGLTLFGTFVMGMVIALTSPLPPAVGISQDVTAALLGILCTSVAAALPLGAGEKEVYFSAAAAISITSLLTGAFLLILGWFRLGNMVRFIPYPVVGGFLAGIGWLLIKGGLGITTGIPFGVGQIPQFFEGAVLAKWAAGLGFAVFLMVLTAKSKHFLTLPLTLLCAVAIFHLVLAVLGIPFSAAKAQGWLLGPFPEGSLWEPLTLSSMGAVNWSVLPSRAGTMMVIALMAAVSLLLNSSGLELALRRDIDLNEELKSNGIANVAAGLCSGPAGFTTLSLSALGPKMGADSRAIGIVCSLVVGCVCFFGASLLGYIPKLVVGALVLLLGLSFAWEWLYEGWDRFSRADYLIMLAIMAVIEWLGFLEGVALGSIAAVIIFVINYSRASAVRYELSGVNCQSSVDRSIPSQRILIREGGRLHILRLQGFLFFGTANNILQRVNARATDTTLPRIRFVVLDFQRVRGMDSSGTNCFTRMIQKAESQGFVMVLTGLSPEFRSKLVRGGIEREGGAHHRFFPDLDHGVEWCEDQILADTEATAEVIRQRPEIKEDLFDSVYDDLMTFLDQREMFEDILSSMSQYLDRRRVARGRFIIRQGEEQHSVFFLESGRVTSQMERSDGRVMRLRTMNPGSVVGELALYLSYTAQESVFAEQESLLHCLSKEALERMEREEPNLAASFHKYMVLILSERLARTKGTLRALLD